MAKIFLDPGHGGVDSGATYKGLIERDINLIVALKCKEELEKHGNEVMMSRTSNGQTVNLNERVRMANNWGATYYVAPHCNSGGGDRGEVIHSIYRGKGLALAEKISTELKAIGQDTVKVYERQGTDNKDYYAVIRETNMDAVIVECAFLDNEVDNDIIDTLPEQEHFGIAIAKGVLKQLGIKSQSLNSQTGIGGDDEMNGIITTSVELKQGDYNASKTLSNISAGTKVKILNRVGNWVKISVWGVEGYVYSTYVDTLDSLYEKYKNLR